MSSQGRAAAGPIGAAQARRRAGIVSSSHLVSAEQRRAVGARVRPDRRLERVLALGGALHGRGRLPRADDHRRAGAASHLPPRAQQEARRHLLRAQLEDTHVVGYSLKKLLAAGLAQGEQRRQGGLLQPDAGRRGRGREVPRGARGLPDRQPRRRSQRRHRRERAPAAHDVGPLRPGRARRDLAVAWRARCSASLMLETRFPRPPGDIGNPATFAFPVRYRACAAPRRGASCVERDPGAARAVRRRGARARARGRRGDRRRAAASSPCFQRELQAARRRCRCGPRACCSSPSSQAALPRRPPRRHRHRRRGVARGRRTCAPSARAPTRRSKGLAPDSRFQRRRARRSSRARRRRGARADGRRRAAPGRAPSRGRARSCSNAPTCRRTPTPCARATGLPVHDITTLRARAARRRRRPPESAPHERGAARRWQFWIDRGGTFTDIVGKRPDGTLDDAKAALREPRAVPRRRGRRHPPPARPRRRRADHVGRGRVR